MEEAHRAAFSTVQDVIDRDIVLAEKIVQLCYLTKNLHWIFSKTDFNNNNYGPEHLKAKIEYCSKYKNSISFAKPRAFESSLVYKNKIPDEKLKMPVKPLKRKLSPILKKLKEPQYGQ